MKKHILLVLLLGSTLILSACEAIPIQSPIQSGSSNKNMLADNQTDSSASKDLDDSPPLETHDAPINAIIDESPEAIDFSQRKPIPTSTENTEGYHDALTPIDPTMLGLSSDMIFDNEGLRPLVEHLLHVQYNYSYGQIGYIEAVDSIYILSNKLNHLPADYVPPDLVEPNIPFYFSEALEKKQLRLEAANHMEDLFAAAKEEGFDLLGASGYRSYATQKGIYKGNVSNRGQEATDKISARPGHSEHQTGLALDVTLHELNYRLVDKLGEMDEGIWLAENAHLYGFIIRYPQQDTDITGYSYEPWHLRYIGKDVATFIYEHKLTVEELYIYIESLIKENTGL